MSGLQTKLYHRHNIHMEENHCAYKVIVAIAIFRQCPLRKRTTILPEISRRLRQQDTSLGLEGWRGWGKNGSYRNRDEAASRAAKEGKPLSFRETPAEWHLSSPGSFVSLGCWGGRG